MALARDRVVLSADVVGGAVSTLVSTTLTFSVQAGYTYHFKAVLGVTGTATSGVGTGISANPTTAATFFAAEVTGAGAVGVGTIDGGYTATYAATGAALGAAGTVTVTGDIIAAGQLVKMEGIVTAAATQVLTLEFQNESGTATTVKKGSYLEWELLVSA